MAHSHGRIALEASMRKLVLLLLAAAGAAAYLLKMQRERELDEAIWEEPRGL